MISGFTDEKQDFFSDILLKTKIHVISNSNFDPIFISKSIW